MKDGRDKMLLIILSAPSRGENNFFINRKISLICAHQLNLNLRKLLNLILDGNICLALLKGMLNTITVFPIQLR